MEGKRPKDQLNLSQNSSDSDIGPPLDGRDAPSALTKKKRKNRELVHKLLDDATNSNSITIDLSSKNIPEIPPAMLKLSNLKLIVLESNELRSLPENFFDCFPYLSWLDLRRNYLTAIPSAYIGRHKCLQNLLLEGNELKTLPLELGLVETLRGLNICNNPLEFPPQEVIDKGTGSILQFMRDLIYAKTHGGLPNGALSAPQLERLSLQDNSDGADSDEDVFSKSRGRGSRESWRQNGTTSNHSSNRDSHSSYSENSDLVGPVLSSAALHRPVSYNQIKQQQYEKFKKAGALGTVERKQNHRKKKRRDKHGSSQYGSAADLQNRIEQRYLEERRLAQLKDLKEKQELILQRRRDAAVLREWRDDGRKLQQDRYREAYMYGGAKDPVDIAEKAPFDIDKQHMRIISNEERIKQDVRETHEKIRRALSPRTLMKMEQERAARDHELQKRIKEHTADMQERRRMRPRGNPQEEMIHAKKELQIAEQLQREIESRRKALEYRFTAFTGESP